MESLVGKDFEQFESRLNERVDDVRKDLNEKIDDVRKDLNDRMDRSETRLKWFISIAVAVGSIATSGIVVLIVSLMN